MTELRDTVSKLTSMLADDFDWRGYYESDDDAPDPRDIFRRCCTFDGPHVDRFECGSYRPSDTPKGLYRLLFLFEPKAVDFSDMYKPVLFTFYSSDGRFAVDVALFKYRLGLYFFAPEECIGGKGTLISGGWPGCDNGVQCIDPDGQAFFGLVIRAVEYEWDVYSGNNFKV